MDGSAFRHLNFDALVWWAIVGVVLTFFIGAAGLGFLTYLAIEHLRIV